MEHAKKKNLSEWVNTYSEELYSWALYKISNNELAKDLVQDTFLAAAEKLEGFKGQSSPKTWLFAILNNKIIDVYRKKVNQPVNTDNQLFAEIFDEAGKWKNQRTPREWHEKESHLLDNPDFREVFKNCLDDLPEKWNICVRLKFLENKKGEEICQETGITPSNFWQIVHRAKLQLRGCLEVNWFKIT